MQSNQPLTLTLFPKYEAESLDLGMATAGFCFVGAFACTILLTCCGENLSAGELIIGSIIDATLIGGTIGFSYLYFSTHRKVQDWAKEQLTRICNSGKVLNNKEQKKVYKQLMRDPANETLIKGLEAKYKSA